MQLGWQLGSPRRNATPHGVLIRAGLPFVAVGVCVGGDGVGNLSVPLCPDRCDDCAHRFEVLGHCVLLFFPPISRAHACSVNLAAPLMCAFCVDEKVKTVISLQWHFFSREKSPLLYLSLHCTNDLRLVYFGQDPRHASLSRLTNAYTPSTL